MPPRRVHALQFLSDKGIERDIATNQLIPNFWKRGLAINGSVAAINERMNVCAAIGVVSNTNLDYSCDIAYPLH